MSLNLIQQVKDLFSGKTIDQLSSQLGESPSAISTAIAGIVPTIFSGLIKKTENSDGSDVIANLAVNAANNGNEMKNDIAGLPADSAAGSSVIATIFGNTGNNIANSVANFAGIKIDSANSLMGIIGTAVLNLLGNYIQQNNTDATGLSNLLGSQREHVASTMPAGLDLSAMSGETPAVSPTTAAHMGADRVTASNATTNPHYAADVESDDAGNGLKWLIPVLLLALLGAGALYYFKGCNNTEQSGTHQNVNGEGMHEEAHHTENDSTQIDSTQINTTLSDTANRVADTTKKVADTAKTVNYN